MSSKIYLSVLLFTGICRAAWFHHLEIDWDEATYLLMGRDIRAGALPYTGLWEIKPPLAFLPYVLFGQSVLTLRLGAVLWIGTAGFITYLAARQYNNLLPSLLAGLSVPLFGSFLFDSGFRADGQAFFTEHAAMLPMALGFYFISKNQKVWTGISAGWYCFTRPALAFVALIQCLPSLKRLVGLSVVPVVLSLTYLLLGEFKVFFETNFTIPRLVQEGRPLSNSSALFEQLLDNFIFQLKNGWWFLLLGVVSARLSSNRFSILAAASLFMAALGIYWSGSAHHHYFLQLVVPASLLLSFSRIPNLLLALFAVCLLQLSYLTYQHSGSGPTKEIKQALEIIGEEKSILCFNNHIIYFLTDTSPPVRAIHPSVYGKDYILEPLSSLGEGFNISTESILQQILNPLPVFIVTKKKHWYFTDFQQAYLRNVLDAHYELKTDAASELQVYKLRM